MYAKLMTNIHDQYSFKKDVYPKALYEAYEILENHSSAKTGKNANNNRLKRRGRGGRFGGREGRGGRGRGGRDGQDHAGGMQFAQTTEISPGLDGHTVACIMCYSVN